MFGIKCLLVLAISCKFEQSNSLMTLPKVEDNNIIITESVIRTTINALFSTIGLKNVRDKPRLKQYSLVHNYFVSLTLQDYNSLKEIAKLTRVDINQIVNDTVDYIALLNEILDEDNVAKLESIIMGVDLKTEYDILNEIEKLEYFKKHHEAQKDKNMELNKEVLKILQQEETLDLNVTTKAGTYYKENDYLLDDLPTWHEKEGVLSSGRRIYNGKRTKVKNFPFMASVQIFNKFQCGGSIIKSDLVITAASCLQLAWNNRFYRENPLFLSVRVGSSFYEAGGEKIGVLEVYFYPSYNPKNLHHNLAVMRLVRKIKLENKRVKKILLDTEPHGMPTTVRIQILGWGARSGSNKLHGPWEDKLRFATLGVYALVDCQDIYSKEYVTKQHFCAGLVSMGSGACNRDVGGPGVQGGKLVGIVSFGSPQCGTPDAPTVFTKVGYYYDWIEEIMEQDVPTVKHRTTLPPPTYRYDPQYGNFDPWLVKPVSTVRGYDVIKSTTKMNALRSEEKQMFKEYLKTMFESAEIKEYLDSMKDKSESVVPFVMDPIQQPTSRYVTTQPIAQQLITQQPMKQQPNVQQGIKQQHTLKEELLQLFLKQNALLQQPMRQDPLILQPLMRESIMQQPIMEQPIMQPPIMQQPIMQQSLMQQSIMPIMQQPLRQQPIMQQPLRQQPIMQQPIMQQPIMQQPRMQQPLVKQPNTQTPDLQNVPEPKATAILEEVTVSPTFNENAQESRESSKEAYNSTVIIPYYNSDTVTVSSSVSSQQDRFSKYWGKTEPIDLAMDFSSTSEENIEQREDPDNELQISLMESNNKNIVRNEPNMEPQRYVKKEQLSLNSAIPNIPHKQSKNKKKEPLDDKIDNELLTLLYLSDSEIQGIGKGHKNKKQNTERPDYDERKSSFNVSEILPISDLSYRQFGQLENDLSILDLRKLLKDDDFLVKILNEEFASGFKSMEVSESPLDNTSAVSQNSFGIKNKSK